MSKLAPALKELINAPFSRPGPAPAPAGIKDLYVRLAREAADKKVGTRPWLAMAAAATITLNSPASLSALYAAATLDAPSPLAPVPAAEFIREVGLKCISFNGIPRSINTLGAFRASLPGPVAAQLETRPSRAVDETNIRAVSARGRGLWDSVYTPFEDKLYGRLAQSHPDLPVHILGSHYGPLLSDPAAGPGGRGRGGLESVGRVLTSVVAVACLRAQGGVGPQVLSHVFGLRKAVEQGFPAKERRVEVEGAGWLAGDECAGWLLRSTDDIVEAIGGNFAKRESKL